ncbi:Uma2 family endonuclease [Litoribacter alkaliphilus]|uniref:Uma2 family endonuclease n=1 Tax=Litoribacter ruber TaxID=702568 RepID=A0AAP2CII0_9BACT|nr:Uma2 family endonuclease [Litoribacter alkaliphilus]MBS9523901.1 Uma2 family endonuclease [Litoribacter alkaliphilus]
MKTKKEKYIAKEPSFSYGGKYSYADYLSWEMDEMVEIIKGKVFKWTAAPSRIHQKVISDLNTAINVFLKGKPCEVYPAPFDVRLPTKSNKNEDIFTVVQPDLSVVCDKSKLDDAGCIGAPDLIVEVLFPSNNKKELKNKYEVYLESGVKEYWVLQPIGQTLLIYTLYHGKYIPSKLYCAGDVVSSTVLEGFELDLEEFFRYMD